MFSFQEENRFRAFEMSAAIMPPFPFTASTDGPKEVVVTIVSCNHLPKMDTFGKCDAFCRVEFGGAVWKTTVQDRSYDAAWNEAHVFPVTENSAAPELKIIVKDKDTVSHSDLVTFPPRSRGPKTDHCLPHTAWTRSPPREKKSLSCVTRWCLKSNGIGAVPRLCLLWPQEVMFRPIHPHAFHCLSSHVRSWWWADQLTAPLKRLGSALNLFFVKSCEQVPTKLVESDE